MAMNAASEPTQSIFGLQAASRLMLDVVPAWTQDLGLLVESIEAARPHGAGEDWMPGAVLRLPYSRRICEARGTVSPQAIMALADAAMIFACAAAWNGYRPMTTVDQTAHFLCPVARFDLLADARVLRAGATTCFGRVSIVTAIDRTPVAMVSGAYAVT
jgi:acyl-coenzyme A thioesterase PaaI-like protein